MSRSFGFLFKGIEILVDVIKDLKNPYFNKIVTGFGCLATIGHCTYTFKTTNNKIIDVQDKYQFTRNGFTEFMIIDKNGEHYNVNNSLWYWKWDSIEDWNKIQTNKQIVIKYYGLRIPLLGIFPNIVNTNALDSMTSAECRILEFNNNRVKEITNILRETREVLKNTEKEKDKPTTDWNILSQKFSKYDDKFD